MKHAILALTALVLAACATTEKTAGEENDAVQDFIALHGIKSISSIRDFNNPNVLFVNLRYIIAYTREEQWLLQYQHSCRTAEQWSGGRMADVRRRGKMLSVRTDTFRGCPLRAAYPISLPQAEELVAVGRGPVEGE